MGLYTSYLKYMAAKAKHEDLKRKYEIVLPPLKPEFSWTRESGNWGYTDMKVSEYVTKINSAGGVKRQVLIGVLDTGGISRSKYLKKGFVDLGLNHSDDATKYDDNGHFSHVCSSIVGYEAGLNLGLLNHPDLPDFYTWFGEKVLNSTGSGYISWISNAAQHAYDVWVNKGYKAKGTPLLLSLSLGAPTWSESFAQIINQLEAEGVFFICAAGNSGGQGVEFPGSHPKTIAVGAYDKNRNIATFSSRGAAVDYAAPGVSIWGADHTENGSMTISGTSMATPHVTGATALILGANPDIKNRAQLIAFANQYTTDLESPGEDDLSGMGALILNKFPVGGVVPDPEPDPKPEPPKPPKLLRRLVLPITTNYINAVYVGNWDNFTNVTVTLLPEVNTTEYAEDAFQRLQLSSRQSMTNRGYYFSNLSTDLNDVAYWVAYFYEMLMKRDHGLTVKTREIKVTDDKGNSVIRYMPTNDGRPSVAVKLVDVITKKVIANAD